MPFAIRSADAGDRDAIVEVFLDCWRGSYANVLPQSLVAAMSRDRATALWERVLSEAPSGEVLAAVDTAEDAGAGGRKVLGVTRLAAAGASGAIHSLYVSPVAQGHGLGCHLLETATAALVDAGCVSASLWVFRDNAPSVAFYRRQGWYPDGAERMQPEFGEPELRFSRVLSRNSHPVPAPEEPTPTPDENAPAAGATKADS